MKLRLNPFRPATLIGLALLPLLSVSAFANYRFTTLGNSLTFNLPDGVAVDDSGNVYVVDTNDETVRKITPDGVVTTIAGLSGTSGDVDDTAGNARFNFPQGVAVDSAGNIYVADAGNNKIRKITQSGVVTTLASGFNLPYGVAVDGSGNVFVADTFNHTIDKVTSGGVVTTIAGLLGTSGDVDDTVTGANARFNKPTGLAVDSSGNIYVADSANHAIRKVTGGLVTTLAGSTSGSFGFVNDTGTNARFEFPHGVAVDSAGNVYVADTSNNAIRKITPAGVVTTFAGAASFGDVDGEQSIARFDGPNGVAVDYIGNVYVADTNNATIRKGFNRITTDFNADGHPDLLWRNSSNGTVALWLMNDLVFSSSLVIANGLNADWQIAGTGDFNHDGQVDILWRQTTTGNVAVWLMNGATIQSTAIIASGVTADWQIAGTGDFNQDGQTDILWRKASTGEVSLWIMNGTTVKSTPTFGVIPSDWVVGGTGDFDGDGETDILWRQLSTGKVAYWLMKGTAIQATPVIGTITSDWVITGVGDFNSDGKPDILWRNSSTGVVGVWCMDGTTVLSTAAIGTVSTDWSIDN